jgi:hypothetical protein
VTFFQMTFDRRTFDFDIVTCAPLVSCPSNIRLGQKWMPGTNTLAYQNECHWHWHFR